jgi:hypothetical protein
MARPHARLPISTILTRRRMMHMEWKSLRRGLWLTSAIALPVTAIAIMGACGSSQPAAPAALGESSDAGGMDVQQMREAAPMMEAAPPPPPMDAHVCVDGAAGFTVSSTDLSFNAGDAGAGLVPCGTAAPSQSLTLTNDTCGAVAFDVTLTNGANNATAYMVSPTTGMIPAGQTQLVTVTPMPIPSSGNVQPNYYGATLTIAATLADGMQSYPVALHQTAQGAIFQPNATSVSFNGVSIGETAEYQLTIVNSGNVAAQLGLATGTSFFTVADVLPDGGTTPPPLPVAPGTPSGAQITFKPTMVQPYTDALVFSTAPDVPLCAPLPSSIALTGNGTTGVSVSPATVPFGLVQCNQGAAPPQPVTISNTGAATTFTVQLGQGASSPYTLQDSMGNTLTTGTPYPLPQASQVVIRVVPKPITSPASTAPGAYNDTLTIATMAPMDSPHAVQLQETAQGAIITLQPASIAINGNAGTTQFEGFTVGQQGNYTVSFTVTVNPTSTFSTNLPSGSLSGTSGTSVSGQLSAVAPAKMTQVTGTLTVAANAGSILCQDVPPAMPLSITGQ